jgi:hypothetical protein
MSLHSKQTPIPVLKGAISVIKSKTATSKHDSCTIESTRHKYSVL